MILTFLALTKNSKSENEFQQNSKTIYFTKFFFYPLWAMVMPFRDSKNVNLPALFSPYEIFAETRYKVRTGATFFPAKMTPGSHAYTLIIG